MKPLLSSLAVLMLLASSALFAADTPLAFADPLRQQRYQGLLEELRCLVCQNQSLADSHADLAQDLRDEVFRMVGEGHDDRAIVDFMVARYGDFVLYRPPVKSSTWLLWLGPGLLVMVGLCVVVGLARHRRQPPVELSAAERARLAALLDARNKRA